MCVNFKKQERSSDYVFRVLDKDQKVLVRYDHTKSGKPLQGVIISDLGQNHSTALVKLDGRKRPIKVHKTDIEIEKSDPNYSNIFSDLVLSSLTIMSGHMSN